MEKPTPIYKIPEAFSAVADGRVELLENRAEVTSSDGTKMYTVEFNDDVYSSNDNATYWQGYAGYPVVAVLMLQGRINFNEGIVTHFKGVNWTELNKKYKKKYDKAVDEILNRLHENGIDVDKIEKEISRVHNQLNNMQLTIKRCGKKVVRLEKEDDAVS